MIFCMSCFHKILLYHSVGVGGIEPPLNPPEGLVLPLHYTPIIIYFTILPQKNDKVKVVCYILFRFLPGVQGGTEH